MWLSALEHSWKSYLEMGTCNVCELIFLNLYHCVVKTTIISCIQVLVEPVDKWRNLSGGNLIVTLFPLLLYVNTFIYH